MDAGMRLTVCVRARVRAQADAVRASPEACRCGRSRRRCEMQSRRRCGRSRRRCEMPETPHDVVELNRADGLSRDLEITNGAERRLREHTREKTSPPANARAKRAQLSERPNESVWRPCAAASEAYEAQGIGAAESACSAPGLRFFFSGSSLRCTLCRTNGCEPNAQISAQVRYGCRCIHAHVRARACTRALHTPARVQARAH